MIALSQVVLAEDVFQEHIEALVESRLQADANLSEMASRHWGEVDARRYEFEAPFSEAAALRRVDRSQVLRFLDGALGRSMRRKLSVRVYARAGGVPDAAAAGGSGGVVVLSDAGAADARATWPLFPAAPYAKPSGDLVRT